MLMYTDILADDQYYHNENCELIRIVPRGYWDYLEDNEDEWDDY